MKCCLSCVYWDKASRKIPINVRRKVVKDEFINIEFRGKVVKLPNWEWIPADPSIINKLGIYRLCFYGKGLISPWDVCDNYVCKLSENKALCEVLGKCMYDEVCPKFKFRLKYVA